MRIDPSVLAKLGLQAPDYAAPKQGPVRRSDPLYRGRENPRGKPEGSGVVPVVTRTAVPATATRAAHTRTHTGYAALPLPPEWDPRRIAAAQRDAVAARELTGRVRRYVAAQPRPADRQATGAGVSGPPDDRMVMLDRVTPDVRRTFARQDALAHVGASVHAVVPRYSGSRSRMATLHGDDAVAYVVARVDARIDARVSLAAVLDRDPDRYAPRRVIDPQPWPSPDVLPIAVRQTA